MRISFWNPAGEHERYAPHAFDNIIGQSAPFKIEGVENGRATVVAVEVAEDGSGATWTVDLPEDGVKRGEDLAARQHASFAIRVIPEHWRE